MGTGLLAQETFSEYREQAIEHKYLKAPLHWTSLKSTGDINQPVKSTHHVKLHQDEKGEMWMVKELNIWDIVRSYVASRLLEVLTKGTPLEGKTVDIRLIKDNNGLRKAVASKYLSNFTPGFRESDVGSTLEQSLEILLGICDQHPDNLGGVTIEGQRFTVMVDLDWSLFRFSCLENAAKMHEWFIEYTEPMACSEHNYKEFKYLASFPFATLETTIKSAFKDITTLCGESQQSRLLYQENNVLTTLRISHHKFQQAYALFSNPCSSQDSLEICSQKVDDLIGEGLYLNMAENSVLTLPQGDPKISWLKKFLVIEQELFSLGTPSYSKFFDYLGLHNQDDIYNFIGMILFLNHELLQRTFDRIAQNADFFPGCSNGCPSFKYKDDQYICNMYVSRTLSLTSIHNQLAITKFVINWMEFLHDRSQFELSLQDDLRSAMIRFGIHKNSEAVSWFRERGIVPFSDNDVPYLLNQYLLNRPSNDRENFLSREAVNYVLGYFKEAAFLASFMMMFMRPI